MAEIWSIPKKPIHKDKTNSLYFSFLSLSNMSSNDGSSEFSRYSYGIGVSVGIILIIVVITLLSHFCNRRSTAPLPSDNPSSTTSNSLTNVTTQPDDESITTGLDDATLRSFPKLLYAHAKLHKDKSTASCCCSVCLADYKDKDMLRLLPDCGHLFHLKCVDPWLRLNPTCPICRNSPLPTPLAEVAPLAARLDRMVWYRDGWW